MHLFSFLELNCPNYGLWHGQNNLDFVASKNDYLLNHIVNSVLFVELSKNLKKGRLFQNTLEKTFKIERIQKKLTRYLIFERNIAYTSYENDFISQQKNLLGYVFSI